MANYYTRFSVMLPLGSSDRIEPALAIYSKLREDLDEDEDVSIGFAAAAAPEVDPAARGVWAEEGGHPEAGLAVGSAARRSAAPGAGASAGP